MAPPFSIRVEDEAPLSLVAATHGGLVLVDEDTGLRVDLAPGDVALARGPDHYVIADDATTDVQVVIRPGQVCTLPDGVEVKVADVLGTRTWGSSAGAAGADDVAMIVGTYERAGEVSRR